MVRLLRLRIIWIAGATLLAVSLSGLGLYVHLRPQPQVRSTSVLIPSPPPQASVGTTTVANSVTAEVLAVVATSPASGSSGTPVSTPITLSFSLPVDPTTIQSYFSVLPTTPGGFAQGKTPQDIVFTPSANFAAGASVNVVLRKGFTSRDGVALKATTASASSRRFRHGTWSLWPAARLRGSTACSRVTQ